MKILYRAFMAALLVAIAAPVLATATTDEQRAPGQPFTHPLNDESYTRNLRDDGVRPGSRERQVSSRYEYHYHNTGDRW